MTKPYCGPRSTRANSSGHGCLVPVLRITDSSFFTLSIISSFSFRVTLVLHPFLHSLFLSPSLPFWQLKLVANFPKPKDSGFLSCWCVCDSWTFNALVFRPHSHPSRPTKSPTGFLCATKRIPLSPSAKPSIFTPLPTTSPLAPPPS